MGGAERRVSIWVGMGLSWAEKGLKGSEAMCLGPLLPPQHSICHEVCISGIQDLLLPQDHSMYGNLACCASAYSRFCNGDASSPLSYISALMKAKWWHNEGTLSVSIGVRPLLSCISATCRMPWLIRASSFFTRCPSSKIRYLHGRMGAWGVHKPYMSMGCNIIYHSKAL